MMRILMNKARSRIRPDIGQEQLGFLKGTRTKNRYESESNTNAEECALMFYNIMQKPLTRYDTKLYLNC